MMLSDLFAKYDVPVPRYTSYPTVPSWRNSPTTDSWIAALNHALEGVNTSIAGYVHIPFCEWLCPYCGCNTVITRTHENVAAIFGAAAWSWRRPRGASNRSWGPLTRRRTRACRPAATAHRRRCDAPGPRPPR